MEKSALQDGQQGLIVNKPSNRGACPQLGHKLSNPAFHTFTAIYFCPVNLVHQFWFRAPP
jgi:hypothetical protein